MDSWRRVVFVPTQDCLPTQPDRQRTEPPQETTTAPAYRIAFGAGADPILWDGKATLLDAALSHGLKPKYGCRSGVCGMCVCKLVRGKVVHVQEPSASTPSDSILLCSTQPASDIEIDLCGENVGRENASLAL
jgi:ferredoxin